MLAGQHINVTRSMLRRSVRPEHELRMPSSLLGLPRLFFYRKENWSEPRNVSVSSISAGTGLSSKACSQQRHGKTIAPSRVYRLTTAGARSRRLKRRFDLRSRQLRAHRQHFCSTSSTAPRCYVTRGGPRRISFCNCRVGDSDSYPSWTAGARASVSPGSPAGLAPSRILVFGRSRLFSTNLAAALCPDATGRPQRSFTRNCRHKILLSRPELCTHWTAGARESVSPGSPVGSSLAIVKCLRYGEREDILKSDMDETSAPLPFVTSSLYPGVVSFTPDMIPERIREHETNVPLFLADGCSVPFHGTICTTDSSPQAHQMLSLLARRTSLSFMLLVALPENAGAEGEILTPSVRRTRVLSALQQIDDADGKSIKDGASNRYREFFVDKEGRPSVSGTTYGLPF
jgi:hypothetical protein